MACRCAVVLQSTDEVDAFTLGFWAGAMAHALVDEQVTSTDEIAERIEAEMKRLESDGEAN